MTASTPRPPFRAVAVERYLRAMSMVVLPRRAPARLFGLLWSLVVTLGLGLAGVWFVLAMAAAMRAMMSAGG